MSGYCAEMGPSSFHHVCCDGYYCIWMSFSNVFTSQYEISTVVFRVIHYSVWLSTIMIFTVQILSRNAIQTINPFQSNWLLYNYQNAFSYFQPVMTVYHWWCYLWSFGYHFANPKPHLFKIEQSLLWLEKWWQSQLQIPLLHIMIDMWCVLCALMWCDSIIH